MISVLLSPGESDRKLAVTLQAVGVRVLRWPTLSVDAPANDSPLQEAIQNLFGYDWLILKNPRAAEHFLSCFLGGHKPEELEELRVFAVGSSTAEKAGEFHIHVDIALDRFSHANICSEIESYVGDASSLTSQNLLVPSANLTRESFEEGLENRGARVDSVAAYRTCSDTEQLARIRSLLAGGAVDLVAFTATSALDEFATLFDTDDLPRLLNGVNVACLDQATRDFATALALFDIMTPSEASIQSLAEIITSGAS